MYEDLKRNFKDTEADCENNGFNFVPMVCEAHSGSWSPQARQVIQRIAKAQELAGFGSEASCSLRIAQRLSVSLHMENARAILRRTVVQAGTAHQGAWHDFQELET